MALKYSYQPQADVGFGTTQNALARWLEQQKQAQGQFTAAAQPLQKAVQMFQPGGGYGKGQQTLLRDEARRAKAEATSRQVASGMSSGSLATGTAMRTERDLATGLAGVEDVRTQFLNQALQALSGLQTGQAQTTAQVSDPTFAPTMGYLASRFGQVAGLNQAAGMRPKTKTPLPSFSTARPSAQTPTFSTPRF